VLVLFALSGLDGYSVLFTGLCPMFIVHHRAVPCVISFALSGLLWEELINLSLSTIFVHAVVNVFSVAVPEIMICPEGGRTSNPGLCPGLISHINPIALKGR